MMSIRKLLLLCLLGFVCLHKAEADTQCECVTLDHEWGNNQLQIFSITTNTHAYGVRAIFTFNKAIVNMNDVSLSGGYTEQIDDTHWAAYVDNFDAEAGKEIKFQFQVEFKPGDNGTVKIIGATFNEVDVCDGSGVWTTPQPLLHYCEPSGSNSKYDYGQALCMSFLFYEAQRSGHLPDDQRVNWRADSAMGDGSDVNVNLTGGYYDAGDHVKFGFPMAFSTTLLSWGMLDFSGGYDLAKQGDYGRKTIKWATDYFLKAHAGKDVLYGQVGAGGPDHAYWGRPEDMTMDRPAAKIDDENPGSELAGETSAALSAAYLVFKNSDSEYAEQLLPVAKELYEFADKKRGNYHNAIPDAAGYYRSWNGYGDELAWAALWLARATGDKSYITRAEAYLTDSEFQKLWTDKILQFSWDDKRAGVFEMFYHLTKDDKYKANITTYLNFLQKDAPYTPNGLVFLDTWGANRHAANVAFIALWASKYGIGTTSDAKWAEGQMDFLLGDAGHSFVCGFGENPPERPHHRSSSCPKMPAHCKIDWAQHQPGPNPSTLYGALVGGPAQDGTYKDERMDYTHNEVACDYNAGFTGALSALLEVVNGLDGPEIY